jgi:hypothetical protein
MLQHGGDNVFPTLKAYGYAADIEKIIADSSNSEDFGESHEWFEI